MKEITNYKNITHVYMRRVAILLLTVLFRSLTYWDCSEIIKNAKTTTEERLKPIDDDHTMIVSS